MYYFNIQPKINIQFVSIIRNAKLHYNENSILSIKPRTSDRIVLYLLFNMNFGNEIVHFKIYKCGLIRVISKTINNYLELLLKIIQILNLGNIGECYTIRCNKRFLNNIGKLEDEEIELPPLYYNVSDTTD
ncbi:hypothetical protein [Saudi moumouvirus]|nr:hypothetical protein [Saudi moumouvirus]